jgi:hypothetical protein
MRSWVASTTALADMANVEAILLSSTRALVLTIVSCSPGCGKSRRNSPAFRIWCD